MAKVKKADPGEATAPSDAARPRIGPYLSAAMIAELVLTETNNKVSIIRIVDKIGIDSETIRNIDDEAVSFALVVIVSFKAGGFKGQSNFLLVQASPLGEDEPIGIAQFDFSGTPNDTWEIKIPLTMKWRGPGQYWFEAYLDNTLFSRIPFEIEIAPNQPQEKQGP